MKKIIILDFSDAEVYIKNYDSKKYEDAEDFLAQYGFDESNCQWMIVNEVKINIE
jgi:beta-lactam-binding protein with PASTA domain